MFFSRSCSFLALIFSSYCSNPIGLRLRSLSLTRPSRGAFVSPKLALRLDASAACAMLILSFGQLSTSPAEDDLSPSATLCRSTRRSDSSGFSSPLCTNQYSMREVVRVL